MKKILDVLSSYRSAKTKTAANIAKERLQIIVSHQSQQNEDAFIQKMQNELMAVISKYVNIDQEKIKVQLERSGEQSTLELNVTLDNPELEKVVED